MATLYDSYRTPDPSTAPGVGGSVTGTVTIVAITQRDAGDGNTLTRLGWKIPVDHGEFSKSGIPPGRYAVEWTLSHGAAMDASMGSGRSPRSITIEDTDTPQRLRVLLGMASIPDTTAADRLREIVADWLADNPIAVTPAAVGSAIAAAGPAQTAVDDRVDAGIESADLLTKTVADATYAALWQPSTAYTAGALVLLPAPINGPGTRTTAGTSRSSFDATEQALWTATGGGSSVSITDNGDGTATLSGTGITDNGDGTATITA